MQLQKISCPTCGASISLDIVGQSYAFCPYCGSHFAIDDGNRTITRNYNAKFDFHDTYTDDAAVEREKRKDRENARDHKETVLVIFVIVLCLIVPCLMVFYEDHKEKKEAEKAIAEGKIQPGQSSDDMEGKDYKVVVEQLRSAGFSDITTIDLDDSGWFTKKKGTVESVAIGGASSFESEDYFYPTAKIVVSYH